MEHETVWTLLCDPAHWIFELILLVVFDGLIGALLWPFIRARVQRWKSHHRGDDKKIEVLEKKVKALEDIVSSFVVRQGRNN
jgi:hypothetical protein